MLLSKFCLTVGISSSNLNSVFTCPSRPQREIWIAGQRCSIRGTRYRQFETSHDNLLDLVQSPRKTQPLSCNRLKCKYPVRRFIEVKKRPKRNLILARLELATFAFLERLIILNSAREMQYKNDTLTNCVTGSFDTCQRCRAPFS
jgi:hypothetical protein